MHKRRGKSNKRKPEDSMAIEWIILYLLTPKIVSWLCLLFCYHAISGPLRIRKNVSWNSVLEMNFSSPEASQMLLVRGTFLYEWQTLPVLSPWLALATSVVKSLWWDTIFFLLLGASCWGCSCRECAALHTAFAGKNFN